MFLSFSEILPLITSVKIVKILFSAKCTHNHQFTLKNFFVDGPQKFLQNHQRQWGFSIIWKFYFDQIGPKNRIILNNPFVFNIISHLALLHFIYIKKGNRY
jgi:hypothetical protein